jgi:hypothetical protein
LVGAAKVSGVTSLSGIFLTSFSKSQRTTRRLQFCSTHRRPEELLDAGAVLRHQDKIIALGVEMERAAK